MDRKKEARPNRQVSKRATANHREESIADFRPFVAYYLFLAGLVVYGAACFVRDMGVL